MQSQTWVILPKVTIVNAIIFLTSIAGNAGNLNGRGHASHVGFGGTGAQCREYRFSILGFLPGGPWLSSMYRVTVRYGPLARAPDLLNVHFTFIVIFNFVKVLGKPTWSPCETMSFKEAG